ncbi:sodium:proton antiporter [Gracilinema caldarium]|uniref:NADH-ubiquinone oxidoreductase chain 4L n=1 Tax=Gracilinema caldarium (strain ATCC 51460 / DSM 7334 / H1) TaxID=744872 RepID=F8F1H1_GRAC1|nr:cation:proton antiporter subunit C [Gracilinema caldarium]AEJ19024.1 NADH-ubiquinone oxidoreductase chain 4L [Gracilinema caldarium DSM 7334]
MINRILVLCLFLLGFYGLIVQKNMVKKVFALSIQNTAVVLLFILEGSRIGSLAPIVTESQAAYVDPIPQALMLTAIVVGICVTALALALVYRLYKKYETMDIEEIQRKAIDES